VIIVSKWKKIDASGYILGRLCSKVAKRALLGEKIVITNAKFAEISGNRRQIIDKYQQYKNVKTASNPRKGPFRVGIRPDIFVRKTIKGMLPKNERGKKAISLIHVYITEIPEDKNQYGECEDFSLGEKFQADNLGKKTVTVEDLCKVIGWNQGGLVK
jgi:large subunit ribosomal protein L13